MTEEQLEILQKDLGSKATEQIKSVMADYTKTASDTITKAIKEKSISKEDFDNYQAATKSALDQMEAIAKKQGTTIAELEESLISGNSNKKSIAQALYESQDELKRIYDQGSGVKTFMVRQGHDGEFFAEALSNKAVVAGYNQTIGGNIGASDTFDPSVTTSVSDAASVLRMGRGAEIVSQFRNTPFIFDLVNLTTASYDFPLATWFEEQVMVGEVGTNVAEGATKPRIQIKYEFKTANYKKAAALISFSEEFVMDFGRLQNDILTIGRGKVIQAINDAILTDVTTNATAYDATGTPFETAVPFANDFDALAAMAAQVDNNTFGVSANAALMSTYKKYLMGVQKNESASYLNRPEVLAGMAFVGNPAVTGDNVIVGDFSKYNIILRGGFLVKVGYNGTDFAENRFSVVLEQFYYNYIPAIHKEAIVKGATFADVKTAILETAPTT